MDRDEFWEKDLLRANKDLMFSCSVHGPVNCINGLRTGPFPFFSSSHQSNLTIPQPMLTQS